MTIFGLFKESWILRVSCKASEALHLNFARDLKYSWFQKLNFMLIFTFYCKYLKYKNIYNLGNKTVLYLLCNCFNGFVGSVNRKAKQPVWTLTANGANTKLVQVWIAVNHSTSVIIGEWSWCSKRIARAIELGSCQSNLCNSWSYERL